MATGRTPIPAGLELVYELEKDNVKNPMDAFVLSIHWSIIRTGLRQRSDSSNPNELTERLPANWSARDTTGSSTRTVTLAYYDPHDITIKYELKAIELTSNDMVAVTFFRSPNISSGSTASNGSTTTGPNRPASNKASGVEKNSAAATFQIANFISADAFNEGQSRERAVNVYEHADNLETQLYQSIMEPLGLRVMGQPPVQGPYDDVTKPAPAERSNPARRDENPLADDRFFRPEFGRRPSPLNPGLPLGPLHIPPLGGMGGFGRSDLDPMGGIGTGMIMPGPHGFRTPRGGGGGIPGFPGGIPPGARFDPFGPPNPNRPDGGAGGSFALPNPDRERPPSSDYDDMFM